MNVIVLKGNIATDIELRYTSNNTPVATFNLAVQRMNDREKADFFPIVVWDKQAENIDKYCSKGSPILIKGRLQTRSYDNANGQKVKVTEVLAELVEFLQKAQQEEKPKEEPKQETNPFEEFGKQIEIEIDEDEALPF